MMTSVRIQPLISDRDLPPARGPRAAALALVAFAFAALCAPDAHAQDDVASCSFFEIQASTDGKGIDKKLSKLKKKLLQPPFSSWTKFDLLKKHDRKLTLTETDVFRIGTGSKLSTEYKQYSRAKKERFKLHLTLQSKNKKKAVDTDFTVYAGDYLVLSISPKRDKSYLLAVTCKKK